MSVEPKKSLAKIRTFARDVEAQREKNGTSITPSTLPAETPKAAPAVGSPTVVREPINITQASAHIPAFHELNKKPESPKTSPTPTLPKTSFSLPAAVAVVPAEQKKPNASVPEKIIRVQPKKGERRSTRDGIIITDNKNNQIKFLPALVASFDSWIKSISKTFEKKAPPTYTVTDTQRRKGVIQKATSKTGSIFTADNETLKEQIRKRQAEAKLEKNSEIFWSPHTEAGVPLLEKQNVISPKPVNVQLAFKKRATPTITVVEPSPVIPLPGPAWKSVSPASEPDVMTFVPEPILPPTPPVEEFEVQEAVAPQSEVPQTLVPVFENVKTSEPSITAEEERPFFRSGFLDRAPGIRLLKDRNTNVITISIVGFIGVALLTVYAVSGVMQIMFPNVLVTTTLTLNKPILIGSTVTAVTLPTFDRATLEQTLRTQQSSDIIVNELSLVDANNVPLSAQTILSFLGFSTNPNFNQSITTLHFGVAVNQPVILLAVSDETTVFGALLEWEPLMARDIGNLLALTQPASAGRFFDKTISTTDVRVLESNGTEVLVYGFLSENVVAITPSTGAFQALINAQQ